MKRDGLRVRTSSTDAHPYFNGPDTFTSQVPTGLPSEQKKVQKVSQHPKVPSFVTQHDIGSLVSHPPYIQELC